ncbi:zinc finger protein 26-like isoform X2 [Neocloeon triangulifer]|uniref:zinc finger protein 26-like isoform X2 n=1 Tax=Neocloeon triangulifer TaxID=2078957 RepID=UPI00286F37EA|nr:zinc finger protein 26-like isoform X2 [Neocloeon triangulifer]
MSADGAKSEDFDTDNDPAKDIGSDDEEEDFEEEKNGVLKVNGFGENGFGEDGKKIDFYEDAHSFSSNCQERYKEVQVCRVCKMSSPSIEAFTSHILEDHTIGALCGFCMISFRSRARLVEHVRTHTQLALKRPEIRSVRKPARDMPRNCKTCKQELSPLSPHTCHANTCKLCQKPLRTRNEFEVHMMRLHCSETACQFCGVKLPSTTNLIYHLKSHTSLRYPAFKCIKCGLRFRSEIKLKQHDCHPIASPDASPSKDHYNSSLNEKNEKGSNSSHAKEPKVHSPAEKSSGFECNFCDQKLKSRSELDHHVKDRHSCRYCKVSLRSQEDFESHMMDEHSSKDECQFCNRKFVTSSALRTHLKIHTSLTYKVHRCSRCKQQFTSLKEKAAHKCQKFPCVDCSQTFPSDTALETHRNKEHSDSTALKCNLCLKYFMKRNALAVHMKTKHKNLEDE